MHTFKGKLQTELRQNKKEEKSSREKEYGRFRTFNDNVKEVPKQEKVRGRLT